MKNLFLVVAACCIVFFALGFPTFKAKISKNKTEVKKPTLRPQRKATKPTTTPPQSRQLTEAQNGLALLVPNITATKSVTVQGGGNPVPGSQLDYSIVVNNAGTDATAVFFTDVLNSNLTLVAGSVKATPIGFNDVYNCIGNVGIIVNVGGGVLANDISPDATSLTVAILTTTPNGTISLSSDGSFTYTPNAGYSGTDIFTYSITSSNGKTGTATANIIVSAPIWFVNSAVASNGTGTLASPFKDWSNFATANGTANGPAINETIFIYSGTYAGAVTLLAGQKVLGQGATTTLASFAGVTPTFANTLPTTSGTNPNLTSTGTTITIPATGAITLRGFDMGNSTTVDIASGGTFGSLTASEMALTGSGAALRLLNGVLAATFTSVTSTSSIAGNAAFTLQACSGSISCGNTSFTASASFGLSLANNTASITFGSLDITPNAGTLAIYIHNHRTGTITCTSGTISATNAFVMDISGVDAANKAPLAMVFTSVSALGSTKSHGMSLVNTSGSFTVNGSGTTAGSGGTITNCQNKGADFQNCTNITLKNMNFTNANTTNGAIPTTADNSGANAALYFNTVTGITLDNIQMNAAVGNATAQNGINLFNCSGFSLANSTITRCGTGVDEACIYAINTTGTNTISNSTISKASRLARFTNNSGTMTLKVTGSSFNDSRTLPDNNTLNANGQAGILFEGYTSGTMSLDVSASCNFLRCASQGIDAYSNNAVIMKADVQNSTFDATNAALPLGEDTGTGMDFASSGTGSIKFNILNNSVKGRSGPLINIFTNTIGSSNAEGTIQGNTITNNYISTIEGAGSGIRVSHNSSNTATKVKINNNSLVNFETFGIDVLMNQSLTTPGRADVQITNNTVTLQTGGAGGAALYSIRSTVAATGQAGTLCTKISGNNAAAGLNGVAQIRSSQAGNIHLMEGNNGGDNTFQGVVNVWNNSSNVPNNTTLVGGAGPNFISAGGASTFTFGATCLAPSNPTLNLRIAAIEPEESAENPTEKVASSQEEVDLDEANQELLIAEMPIENPVAPRTEPRSSSARMMAGETVTVNGTGSGFNLPATKSTTITFSATVSSTPSTCAITNQASVSGSGFTTVNSNTTTTNLIIPVPTAVTPSSATSVCTGTPINLNATCATGTVNWYTVAAPTTLLGNVASGVNFPQSPISNTTYTAKCLAGGCESVGTNTALITATPNNTITLTSAAGTNNQTKCINTALTNITYSTTGAAGATFSGLPTGVTGALVGNVVTISGTPTTATGSPFGYTVTLMGGCGNITATGTITVLPTNTVTLTSAAGTNAQTVPINTAITNITYATTGATGATFSGLPAGVSGAWLNNVVTISGSPTTATGSPFGYTVTLTGGCGTVTATGTITVTTPPTITTGTVTGTISACAGTASTNTQSFSFSTANLTATFLVTAPTGFEVSFSPGSGFGSSVTLNSQGASGTIYVRSSATATAGSISGNVSLTSTGATTQNVAVSGTINSTPAPTSPTATPSVITVSGNTTSLTATGCGSPSTLTWYDSANPTVAISSTQAITSTKTFFARCTGANTCVSDPSANVTVTYNPCTPLGASPGNVGIAWTGLSSTNWNDACNWNPAWVPDATNSAVVIDLQTNQPTITGTVPTVNQIYINSNATLTVNSGGTLNANSTATSITLQGGNIINDGTINLSGGGTSIGLAIGATASITNRGTITTNNLYGASLQYGNLTFTNESTGIFSGDFKANNNTLTLTNRGTINYPGGTFALSLGSSGSSVINDGTISITGGSGISNPSGSTITNNACGKILMTTGDYQNGGTTTNAGLIQLPNAYDFTNTSIFTNNGVLKANTVSGITNNKMVITNACPIFTLGGTNNYTVNGIFTNVGATTSAGSYASNVFTANNTIPTGSQTLYASVTNGTCSFVVPFTFVNEKPTAVSISPTSICVGSNITLSATCASGTVNWYAAATGGASLGTGASFTYAPSAGNGQSFYASCESTNCKSGRTVTSNTVDVNGNINTITLSSSAGTNSQSVCINTALANITYATTGATGATFSGLPTGVTGAWASNVATISGTPTTATGSPFTYTVTLTGGCGTVTATGTITVTPANTVTLTSAAGTNAQSVCISTALTNITYATTQATGATFSGLPTGVSGVWAGNVATISGTPSTATGSPFGYTVTLTGGCGTITATGTIAVTTPSAAPIVGSITQPTCTTATGSVPLSGLPATGTWTLTRSPGAVSSMGTGATTTVSGLVTNTYSFTVTNADGCVSAVSSNAVINVQPSTPSTFNVTGGGLATCGTGVAVGLSASQTATTYQLRKDGSNLGSPVAGTGAAIAFGLQNAVGTYSVVAMATTGGCTATMAGNVVVMVVSSISSFTLSGGGVACGAGSNSGTGGAGVGISLSGSQIGVNYQLRRGTINSGTAVAGTGAALNFPNQTIAGTYTVVASAGSCPNANMGGSAVVTVGALPVVYNVTGGGTACGTGSVVNLSNSQSGVNYQLKRGTTNVGAALAGTGVALVFAKQTVVGSYSVEATNASTACVRPMSGTANITACPTRQGVEESSDNADWAIIAPNPIVSQQLVLEVRGVSEQTVVWQLVNAQGSVLNQSQFEAQSPHHRQAIEVGNLKTGSYILRLQSQSKKANLKVLKAE